MSLLLYAAAVVLLAIALWDAFVTVFSAQGCGPVTAFWTSRLWRAALAVHERRPMHRALSMIGPTMLVLSVLVWYTLLASGWVCLFMADADSLIETPSKDRITSWGQTVYFVGVTLAGVGYGDYVPAHFPWTLLSNLAALSSAVVLTVALSYILPVVSASIERKYLARRVFSIGDTVEAFIDRCWCGPDSGALDDYLLDVVGEIDRHAHKHLAYPVLHYFHSSDPKESPGRAVLLLSDAVFLIGAGSARAAGPPRSMLRVINSGIDNFADLATTGASGKRPRSERAELPDGLSVLEKLGLPTVDRRAFDERVAQHAARRLRLVGLCRGDGWRDC
ncbi:potassium channel family protein [Botrimarina sp.]|uniref:potassium channel family protein n=1 Tax=Botrimarina sp. TaxID=2795802 RepID=UPI0032EB1A93